jgi:hypothetical protein
MLSPNLNAPRLASGRSVDRASFRDADFACSMKLRQVVFQDLLSFGASNVQEWASVLPTSVQSLSTYERKACCFLMELLLGRKKRFVSVRASVACVVHSCLYAYLNFSCHF